MNFFLKHSVYTVSVSFQKAFTNFTYKHDEL